MTPGIVVTGAAGYIGSRVTARLVESDFNVDVRPIDTFENGQVRSVAGIDIEWVDIRDYPATQSTLADADVVVHLAAQAGVNDCFERPGRAFETNVMATANIAMLCTRESIGLTLASSFAVHGVPGELPVTAKTPRRPLNWYGRTKATAEAVVEALSERSFPAHIIRGTNGYGSHEVGGQTVSKPTVINYFMDQARQGEPMTVHEPGTQVRDFVHVDDLARAYELSVRRMLDVGQETRVYPVASGETQSVMDLAELVADAAERDTGVRPDIRMQPNPRDEPEPSELAFDLTPTERDLGWEPRHSLADGVRFTTPEVLA